MIVFVSGPYTAATRAEIDDNIVAAQEFAGQLWEMGHAVICPHLNTYHFEDTNPGITQQQYYDGYCALLARCDAVVFLEGWERSEGCKREYAVADRFDIPMFFAPHKPKLSSAELRCPEQFRYLSGTLTKMYRTLAKKNDDYGTGNIALTGLLGVVVRMSDKMSRLLNLNGFKFNVTESEFVDSQIAVNEPLIDSLVDMAGYAMIGLAVHEGVWGR